MSSTTATDPSNSSNTVAEKLSVTNASASKKMTSSGSKAVEQPGGQQK
jgi:hypothetical protein